MTKITPCNTVGFHYNGFWTVLDSSNPVIKSESPIKFFKKFYFGF
jgi:hypothetical protein